ncbi:LysE family transporter [Fulvivirga sp.]|uniref:LysE family translocator n=1 Tax=Fulvivirga sp. TaxID=1931237 RepID=UPI0032EB4B0E
MAFVNGLLFGFTLMVMIGPVFFTILQTSLEKGFGKSILVAIGVSLGDVVMILLTYFGLSQVIGFEENKELIGYIGAIILAVFGIVNILRSNKKFIPKADDEPIVGFYRFIFKGLAINAISPFVPVFWIGTMSLATIEYGYKGYDLVVFFVTILIVVFSTDVLKGYLAARLSKLINERVMKILSIAVGIILILFAIRMATYSW